VCGGVQPVTLARALGTEHRENGLAARLLLAWPPRMPKRWTEADVSPDLECSIAAVFGRLYGLQPTTDGVGDAQPVIVPLSADGKAAWVNFYNAHGLEQANLSGDLAAAWSKLEGYAARLALVVHFVRWAAADPTLASADKVDTDSIAAGVTLSRWFGHEATRVYRMLVETDEERDRRRLVELIGRKGGAVTVRELQRTSRLFRTAGEAEIALDALAEAGVGRWERQGPRTRGGRPARIFRLNDTAALTQPPTVLTKPPLALSKTGCVNVGAVGAPEDAPASQAELDEHIAHDEFDRLEVDASASQAELDEHIEVDASVPLAELDGRIARGGPGGLEVEIVEPPPESPEDDWGEI